MFEKRINDIQCSARSIDTIADTIRATVQGVS